MKVFFTSFFIIAGSVLLRAQDADDHKSQIATELVGRWCFLPNSAESIESLTNSCINLNVDGTYDISVDQSTLNSSSTALSQIAGSDAGTWWVVGNLLYYNSTTRGKGRFRFQKANHPRLEKTPVIIIEGAIFCSPTPRDPW